MFLLVALHFLEGLVYQASHNVPGLGLAAALRGAAAPRGGGGHSVSDEVVGGGARGA